MAKLKADTITKADLVEFLDDQSDFAFEVQTRHALIDRGFSCDHSGTYDDPATDKPREFDIRSTKQFTKCFLRLAVECKNLRPNFPLLISCLPRRKEEAFHEIVYSVNPETNPIEKPTPPYIAAMLPVSKSFRITGEHTFYKEGDPVGKSCDQVGRNAAGEIASGDSGIYEKWAQALSSSSELTALACRDGSDRTGDLALSLVIPVVVVPNGRLWRTQYDAVGKRVVDPEQTERCSYFVGRHYYHRFPAGGDEMTISHLEFVTFDGLLTLVDDLCGDNAKVKKTFSDEYMYHLICGKCTP